MPAVREKHGRGISPPRLALHNDGGGAARCFDLHNVPRLAEENGPVATPRPGAGAVGVTKRLRRASAGSHDLQSPFGDIEETDGLAVRRPEGCSLAAACTSEGPPLR